MSEEEAMQETAARPLDQIVASGNIRLHDLIAEISESLFGIKQNYLKIGWLLKYIREAKLYEEDGFKNINEFAAHHFNLSQSAVSRLIGICEEFSVGDRPELMQRYASYNLSQLTELLPMKEELRKQVTPEMTVVQIRALKRGETKADSDKVPEEKSEKKEIPENKTDAADEPYEIPRSNKYVLDYVERDWQIDLPRFRDDDERSAWVRNAECWGTWYIDPNSQTEYFKYDFMDGSRLIATKYKDIMSRYDEEIVSDEIHYHMIFSKAFLEKHQNDYLAGYQNHWIHSATPIEFIMDFLSELQSEEAEAVTVEDGSTELDKGYDSNECIMKGFDPDHLERINNFIEKKYAKFYRNNKYIPRYFDAKHGTEVADYARTLTTGCGSASGIGSHVFFKAEKEAEMLINNEDLDEETASHMLEKILQVAKPQERKMVEEMLGIESSAG